MISIYCIVPAHQTGDDVACGAQTCWPIDGNTETYKPYWDSYWIVPGTVDEED